MSRSAKRKRARARREYVARFFRAYIAILRRILKRRGIPEGCESPCRTCAFQPSTDTWRGFETTMLGLLTSVERGTPFVCHENLPKHEDGSWYLPTRAQPSWNPDTGEITWPTDGPAPRLCAGYEAIKDDPETKLAPMRAIRDLGAPPAAMLQELAKKRLDQGLLHPHEWPTTRKETT